MPKSKPYKCREKRNGAYYQYLRYRFYDSKEKRYKNDPSKKARCLGRVDEQTGELVPKSAPGGIDDIAAIQPTLPFDKLRPSIESALSSGQTGKSLSGESVGVASNIALRILARWLRRDLPDVSDIEEVVETLLEAGGAIRDKPIKLLTDSANAEESNFEYWSFSYTGRLAERVEGLSNTQYTVETRKAFKVGMVCAFDATESTIPHTYVDIGDNARRKVPASENRLTWIQEESNQSQSTPMGRKASDIAKVYWRDRPGMLLPSPIYIEEKHGGEPHETLASVMNRILGLIVYEIEELTAPFLARRKFGKELKSEEKSILLQGVALSGVGLVAGLHKAATDVFGFDAETGVAQLVQLLDGVYNLSDVTGNERIIAGELMRDWLAEL